MINVTATAETKERAVEQVEGIKNVLAEYTEDWWKDKIVISRAGMKYEARLLYRQRIEG